MSTISAPHSTGSSEPLPHSPLAADPVRRPRAVFEVGSEPDPRFSMANERTALAWVRTALAMVAGGIGLISVARYTGEQSLSRALAAALSVVGAGLAISAVTGWRGREVAMRTGVPLPAPAALPWVAGIVVILGGVLAGVVAATW